MMFNFDNMLVTNMLMFTIEFKCEYDADIVSSALNDNSTFTVESKNGNIIVSTRMLTYYNFIDTLETTISILKSKSINAKDISIVFSIEPKSYSVATFNITKFVINYDEEFVLGKTKDKDIDTFEDFKNPKSLDFANNNFEYQCKDLFSNNHDLMIDFTDASSIKVLYYEKEDSYNLENIKIVLNFIINCINKCMNTEYGQNDLDTIEEINKKFKEVADTYSGYDKFCDKFKNISLLVDMSNDISICSMYFQDFIKVLFTISKLDIKDCEINYDTDTCRLQIKSLDKSDFSLKSILDIVESKLKKCKLVDCDIYDTDLENATIINCNIFGYGKLKNCKIIDCFVNRNIECTNCKVTGKLGRFGGQLDSGEIYDTSIINGALLDDKVKKENIIEC